MDKPADPSTPFGEVYQSFLDDLALEGTKPSTIHRYRYNIVRFEKWLVANGHPAILGSLERTLLIAYRQHLETVRSGYRILRPRPRLYTTRPVVQFSPSCPRGKSSRKTDEASKPAARTTPVRRLSRLQAPSTTRPPPDVERHRRARASHSTGAKADIVHDRNRPFLGPPALSVTRSSSVGSDESPESAGLD
jgi:hypothetical protein